MLNEFYNLTKASIVIYHLGVLPKYLTNIHAYADMPKQLDTYWRLTPTLDICTFNEKLNKRSHLESYRFIKWHLKIFVLEYECSSINSPQGNFLNQYILKMLTIFKIYQRLLCKSVYLNWNNLRDPMHCDYI